MTAPSDSRHAGAPDGRFSRRRAMGALATGGLAAGLVHRAMPDPAQAQDTPSSTQVNPDGTTPFNFHLAASEPVSFAAGTFRIASQEEMPRIEALSIHLVEIAPGGVREVHWHPNASEINYVLTGEGVVGVLSTSGENAISPVGPGTTTFIAQGDAHFIENTGSAPLTLLIGFSSPDPDHISLSQALPWVPATVVAQVLDLPPGALPPLPPRGDLAIVPLAETTTATTDAPAPFSAPLDALPESAFGGGTVQVLRPDAIPSLAGMTMLRLVIDQGAVREPHWHGNAAEFNYCVQGTGQIGIVSPSGEAWTFVVSAGDVAFIPTNWFHYIANVGEGPLELVAFFDDVAPSRIDLSTMAEFFPSAVLAASFGLAPGAFGGVPDQGTVVIAPPRDGGQDSGPAATPAP
jgi:oxalate decarboxylase